MEKIVRCMDCGYCDVDSWGAWCNKENAQLNDVCDEHKCDSFFPHIEKEASCQQLSKALCGKENATLGEMLEAAEQLKQRAEPENRPLTVNEATGSEDPVWLETRKSKTLIVTDVCISADFRYAEVYKIGSRIPYSIPLDNYGKLWRCWPRKPSPEQMAAAEWEE